LIGEPHPRAPVESIAQEKRVIDWLKQKAHWPERLRNLGAWFVGGGRLPVRRFLHALRHEARNPDARVHRELPPDRLHDGRDGETRSISTPVSRSRRLRRSRKVSRSSPRSVGVLIGGLVVARLGTIKSLALGSVLVDRHQPHVHDACMDGLPKPRWARVVVGADNLAQGVAGTALIAYLSSLTSASYTATQYALFSLRTRCPASS
jgi:PAT family beta-lactamase induction signal transducer AmpG